MKIKCSFLCLFVVSLMFGQGMEVGPLTNLQWKESRNIKSVEGTVDSTFVFTTDTIPLPLFDDFSSNKFQKYNGDYNGASTQSTLFYHLTDPVSFEPIYESNGFTNQPTFRRVFDMATGDFSDTIFDARLVRVGDLSRYPIQYEGLDLYPPYFLIDSINDFEDNPTDTIWLNSPEYLQDSARVFFQHVVDPSKFWVDNFTFHNYRFAKNPHSLGVVTFDGLDENGNPYEFGSVNPNYADVLTSKSINLEGYDASDSIFLTFLYQPEGLGDVPESTDSLILEFYSPSAETWSNVWSVSGTPNHDFKAKAIGVLAPEFCQNGFRFRFKNYGSLAGSLDHFHLDYVHLRSLSNSADTLNKDFAFSYPISSLLKDYTSVPWEHYKASAENHMTDSLSVQLYNGSELPENYQDGLLEITYNGLTEGSVALNGFVLAESNINFQPRTLHSSFHDLTNDYEFDRTKTGTKQMFRIKSSALAQFPNFTGNDSSVFEQEFYNYYSYDDGSAEAAFGPTGVQARLSVAFEPYLSDSLIGISFCFVPSVNEVSDKQFLLSVWEDNEGKPGNLLYEDDVFYPRSPVYGYGKNQFHNYYFNDSMKVFVDGRFHIGWRQFDQDRLNLGLDRNTDQSSKIHYSIDGGDTWLASPFPGSAMMRPIFSTALDAELGHDELPVLVDIDAYPNPCSMHLKLNYPEQLESSLLSSEGVEVLNSSNNNYDVSNLPSGIYFLRVPSLNVVKKIIVY